MDDTRRPARVLAARAVEAGEPLRWFEELYASSAADGTAVPWADLAVNPHLASWPGLEELTPGRALVVGCGYGDDAEWLAAHGWDVTAFDVSPTAISQTRRRFPDTTVHYLTGDLLNLPAAWSAEPFDLVVEIYTIQVLPPGSPERRAAIRALGPVTGGTLLIVARGRGEADDSGTMPWPLTRDELDPLTDSALAETGFEDFLDAEEPPTRRFRSTYRRQLRAR